MKRFYTDPESGRKYPIFEGGKGDTKKAEEAAEKSYQLQLKQFEMEKKMLEEQKRLQDEEELRKRMAGEVATQRKKAGVKSTILTDDSLLNPTISKKSLYA